MLDETELKKLYEMEAKGINAAYGVSEKLGASVLNNAIASFMDFLTVIDGKFIPGMNINYRVFIVGLLESIDDKYLEAVFVEIMFPKRIS